MIEWAIILFAYLINFKLWIPLILLASQLLLHYIGKNKLSFILYPIYTVMLISALDNLKLDPIWGFTAFLIPSWYILVELLQGDSVRREGRGVSLVVGVIVSVIGVFVPEFSLLGIIFLAILNYNETVISKKFIKENIRIIAAILFTLLIYVLFYPGRSELSDSSTLVGVTLLLLTYGYYREREGIKPREL